MTLNNRAFFTLIPCVPFQQEGGINGYLSRIILIKNKKLVSPSFPHSQDGYILFKQGCFRSVFTPACCLNLGSYTSHKALEAVALGTTSLRFLSAHFIVVLILSPAAGQLLLSGFV